MFSGEFVLFINPSLSVIEFIQLSCSSSRFNSPNQICMHINKTNSTEINEWVEGGGNKFREKIEYLRIQVGLRDSAPRQLISSV